jgi:hypothetical protein
VCAALFPKIDSAFPDLINAIMTGVKIKVDASKYSFFAHKKHRPGQNGKVINSK